MEITQIIDKYGVQIAETLKVATTEVYEKVIWYTRLSGVISLVEILVVFALIYPWYLLLRAIDKNWNSGSYRDEAFAFAIYVAGAIGFIIFIMILSIIVEPITKIFLTEYYLINTIINSSK